LWEGGGVNTELMVLFQTGNEAAKPVKYLTLFMATKNECKGRTSSHFETSNFEMFLKYSVHSTVNVKEF
jgi:hypothetical protein